MNVGDIENNVLIGKDGWLFLFSGDQDEFDYLIGNKNPSMQSITNLANNIKSRSKFLKNINVPYVHIVFPSKSLVYHDKINNYPEIRSVYKTHYAKNMGYENILYPIDVYKGAREFVDSFQKLDTHISFEGSKLILKEILVGFGLDSELADYCPYFEADVTGDLATMIHSENLHCEKIPVKTTLTYDNLSALPGKTNNICISVNKFAKFDKKILLIGDSFIKEVFYAMSYIFSDIIYVRSQNFQYDVFYIFKPDYVITSGVERYLSNIVSDDDGYSVLMEKYGDQDYPVDPRFSHALRAFLSWNSFPAVRSHWLRSMTGINLYFDGIGHGRCNEELSAESRTRFLSHGVDPQIEFNLEYPDVIATLEAEICCTQETDAQLFFSFGQPDEPKFTEERSIRHRLAPGFNRIVFSLPSEAVSSLRFDPVQLPGEIEIQSIVLTSRYSGQQTARGKLGVA